MGRKRTVLVAFILCLVPALVAQAEEARILRFADIHEGVIAFVYAGDIWTVPSTGGDARRLTSHPGMELFPKFSPDGSHIAFSAEYGGNRQIWVMPTVGGAPRQLTYYNDVGPMPPRGGFDYRVLDWTPDGKEILFRANRLPWGVRMGRPYTIPFEGGMERPLEVPETGGGMFSPDGKQYVFTPIDREFRTWKRHQGGRAQNVWLYDLKRGEARQITEYRGTDNQPLWVGDKIYFTSDRENGRLNLWSADPQGGGFARVTKHDDFDVLWPSAGPRQIVYECGGFLYRLDPSTGDSKRVPVEVTGDFIDTLPSYRKATGQVTSVEISPSGKRAVVVARGDVFTVPAEKGETRNLTRTPGTREHSATWSPDGMWIAYLGDATGEYEIYLRKQDGSGEERRLTGGASVWKFPPLWSPDSTRLAYGDRDQKLIIVDVEDGGVVEVDHSPTNNIRDYRWSADGSWLVYTKLDDSRFSSIFVYDVEAGEVSRLTDELTNDYSPVIDPEGRYLYFLSDRDYNLTFSGYEFNYFYTDPTRIYAATLQADGPALLAPKSDEEQPADEESGGGDEAAEKADDDAEAEDARLEIDVEGFGDRVVALPEPAGNYTGLSATAGGVFYLAGDPGSRALKGFSIESEKAETYLEGVNGYEISADGKKVLYRARGGVYGIVDLAPGKKSGDGKLSLDGLELRVEPPAEWQQIYADGWRITRDWFYDAGMHGLDWDAMRELYQPMVDSLRYRGDLDYILGELGGELNAGHFYVNWGDMPSVERRDGGLLGAEIEAHGSGYFRIARIFSGENWHPDFRSPLTEAGVDADEGDFILAVDGVPATDAQNVYELLQNAAGRTVRLLINDKPKLDGAHEEHVRPIARETNLRYLDWIRTRREIVERLSDGRIGYVHMPNTAGAGNRELRKYFYPQAHKEALIFDVRYNGGGFIPDRMMELVGRQPLSYWKRRGVPPMRTPGYAHSGPKACLINAYSSSGGDAFPYYFRKMQLGPLIGTRTWGGLIGLSGNPGFMDGGSVNVPTFRFMDTDGNWDVENIGVAPDVRVVDRPDLVAGGQDPTLEKAIEVLMKELERNPPQMPEAPEPPRMDR
ncbi:MAG: hypothetical protein GY716_08105 [bacterium]|nr:hypothetical protein [bacterium]